MNKTIAVIIVLGLLIGVYFVYDSLREMTQTEIESNKTAAYGLIRIIEEYNKDNKKYPDTAGEMVPKYIKQLPDCIRCDWKYIKSVDGLEFEFGFMAYHYWYYNSKTKKWIYDSM